jgi:hypothetical protein
MLLALDARGRAQITKAELGALVGLKERQVATVLGQLEVALRLIQKERQGGEGRGRAANSYVIRPDATGNPVPATWCQQQPSAGNAVPSASPAQQSNTGIELPVACGEVLPPMNRHGRARGLDKTSKVSTLQELHPESVESVINKRARPQGFDLADLIAARVDSPYLDPSKQQNGLLYQTSPMIVGWIDPQQLGADLDHEVVPTVARMCNKLNGHGEPIERWNYFDKEIRKVVARRVAASQPQTPITAAEANTYDRNSNRDSDPGVRRRQRSALTERAMRLMSGGDEDELGRMGSVPCK